MEQITKALLKFHQKMGKIAKDSTNPFFKSKYASLPNILDAVSPVLNECELVIIQMPVGDGFLKTILSHVSGENIESDFDMKIIKNDPQALGSAITYARRYAIGAVLCLNIDDDDDGNKATQTPQANKQANSNEKAWLNATNKDGSLNKVGIATAQKIASGSVQWEQIQEAVKVSKGDRSAIDEKVNELKGVFK